jgi:hypothetical protein
MPRAKGSQRNVSSPKIISGEAHKAVGRPGFRGTVQGTEGKISVRRVRQIDPARGITQPGADKITSTNIDLVGEQSPRVVGGKVNTRTHTGKKTIRRPSARIKKR